ncbi:chromosome segregation protein SMC [Lautropia dentalis]|uniref:Chromosome segregation protein SMC n=1 Tax=Lautropia dentalis TaxID=2490857 RepID=A0A3R8MWN5_9BURK|nr:ATP-binding protein [Lautropia dentalis]RRN44068.1 chromosome segregation protein SMC [Lautropia dentalis]
MQINRLILKNWRNFKAFDARFQDVSYLLGPNASGKSNLLDVFRFLRDISKPKGGGLQSAVDDRGGIVKVRCLHARNDTEVLIDVHLSDDGDDGDEGGGSWRYVLGFKPEGKGAQRILVSREQVWEGEQRIINRPDDDDVRDRALLTQTRLEQIAANARFRKLAEFFGNITYLHLVPQLLKFSEQIGGNRLENDPFGQGFLDRIARTPEKTRDARLRKIGEALSLAVPHFKDLRFVRDEVGRPHLEAMYQHHRPKAGWQTEEQFSDGTLRLIGILWSLLEGSSMLLMEEPEISLNNEVVRQIPVIIDRLQRGRKRKRQVVISTHSEAMLDNKGIDGRGVILLVPASEGSGARGLTDDELQMLVDGLSVAETILPMTRPGRVEQLGLWK